MKDCNSNKCPTSQNGKGSKSRTDSFSQFQKNYDKIKWQHPSGELLNTETRKQE